VKKGEWGVFVNGDSPFLDPGNIRDWAAEFKGEAWAKSEKVSPILDALVNISCKQREVLNCMKNKLWSAWSGFGQEINFKEQYHKWPDRFKMGTVPNAIEFSRFAPNANFALTGLFREELDYKINEDTTLHERSCGQLREAAKGQVNTTYRHALPAPFRGLELNPDGTLIDDIAYIF
jgi:hypothetical protein